MERTEKKLREGGFFYRKLFERDRMAFGEPEEWAFYLSAFLNAGRSVDYRLRHEQSSYPTFGEVWNGLHPAEDHFMKFMSLHPEQTKCTTVAPSVLNARGVFSIGNCYKDKSGAVTASNKDVAESQKLRRLTIHALRHSFASILLMGGTPDAEVSAQLGHADVYTTKKFTAISYRRWATDAAARLGSLLLKSKPEPKAGSGVDF